MTTTTHITPIQRQALLAALQSPTHTLRRGRRGEGGCGMRDSISVNVCTHIDTDVDVDIDDIIESCSPDDLKKLAARIGNDSAPTTVTGVGDPATARYVERAYLAALRVSDLPREIADLFWHVHGRAI